MSISDKIAQALVDQIGNEYIIPLLLDPIFSSYIQSISDGKKIKDEHVEMVKSWLLYNYVFSNDVGIKSINVNPLNKYSVSELLYYTLVKMLDYEER